ncbi:MAG TPA: glycosyltransferase family 4 protein [Longimicrobiaceae bacterium]|nr:glycosyltransferase family 4 protein [Longimicrobiaceae bacterium]
MKVLYISKALVVAEYRTKLLALAAGAELTALVPDRWGARTVEPSPDDGDGPIQLRWERAWLHGNNHLHISPLLGKVIDSLRPDLVHIDEEPYSLVTLQAARLCAKRGIPCLFFAWQNLPKRLPPPFARVRARVYRTVSGGIAGTPAAGRVLRDAGFSGPLAIIPQFGVDASRFRPRPADRASAREAWGIAPDDFAVGFGGRLVPEKGIDRLIRAIVGVPSAKLLIAGEGPERGRLMKMSLELGVAGRVRFIGHLPSTSVPGWLTSLDALALPSLSTPRWTEQFGRILVEAMASGVPVVASRCGEIPHVVGAAGLLTDEGGVDSLAGALASLATSPGLRSKLAEQGRVRALEHFTQDRIAAQTLEFYESLCGARSA